MSGKTLALCAAAVAIFLIAVLVSVSGNKSVPRPSVNYNSHRICDKAFEENQDHANENQPYYDLTLTEGCFGPFFRPPKSWHSWQYQALGDTTGYWIAFWYQGWQPQGPFGANDRWNFAHAPIYWRLQGHGRWRVYSNDVVPAVAKPPNASESTDNTRETSPERHVRIPTITNKPGDPHQCGQADYYMNFGPEVPHPAGYGGLTDPKFLFSSYKETDTTWAADFTGVIPVCLTVDEQGNTKAIRLLHSPGKVFDEKMTQQISQWKYAPGTFRQDFRDVAKPVAVTMEFDYIFR